MQLSAYNNDMLFSYRCPLSMQVPAAQIRVIACDKLSLLSICCAGDAAGDDGQHTAATKFAICAASKASGHAYSTGECTVRKLFAIW
jgi:hypothetical protein